MNFKKMMENFLSVLLFFNDGNFIKRDAPHNMKRFKLRKNDWIFEGLLNCYPNCFDQPQVFFLAFNLSSPVIISTHIRSFELMTISYNYVQTFNFTVHQNSN